MLRDSPIQSLGRHLIVDLFDCNAELLNNVEAVKGALVGAAREARATIVATTFHQFNPFGLSGIVVIAESHLSIHTWPEHRYAAVDLFSCGETLTPEPAIRYLVNWLAAGRVSIVELQRGILVQQAASLSPRLVAVDSS